MIDEPTDRKYRSPKEIVSLDSPLPHFDQPHIGLVID